MPQNFKKVFYSILAAAFSAAAWFCFSGLVGSGALLFSTAKAVGFFGALALSYAFLFVLALSEDKVWFILASLVSSVWILIFLGTGSEEIISAVALFAATQVMPAEFPGALRKSLSLRYFSSAYSKIALVALVLIGISSGYLQQDISTAVAQKSFGIQAANYTWPLVRGYVSEFNSDQTVDQFLVSQFRSQGIANPSQAMLADQRSQLSQQFGFNVRGTEKMSDLGKTFLAGQINSALQNFDFARTGLYLIFLALLFFWPFWRFLFAVFAAAIYWLLRRLGAIKVIETQVIAKYLEV